MRKHSAKRQGDITEIKAVSLLLDKGYEVYKNVSCVGKIDIIVYRPRQKDYLCWIFLLSKQNTSSEKSDKQ